MDAVLARAVARVPCTALGCGSELGVWARVEAIRTGSPKAAARARESFTVMGYLLRSGLGVGRTNELRPESSRLETISLSRCLDLLDQLMRQRGDRIVASRLARAWCRVASILAASPQAS